MLAIFIYLNGDNMKIGIITRTSIIDDKKFDIVVDNIYRKLKQFNVSVVGIILDSNYKNVIDECDGIIFQGGSVFEEYDMEALKYIYEKDIPTLGICLGMQLMGVFLDGTLEEIDGHLNTEHDVIINRHSKIYDNNTIVKVNSRHKYVLKDTNAQIVGRDMYGNIEAIEDKNKKFFVGVQWHPEDIDDKVFSCFIKNIGEEDV